MVAVLANCDKIILKKRRGRDEMNKYLVLDIGGSAIKYAIMDDETTILEKNSVPTPLDTLKSLMEVIGTLYDSYKEQINGMAISLPGVLNSDTGYMYSGGSLVFNTNHNFIETLKRRCPITISIENDGKCAALAEIWKGSLQGIKNGAVILLGTGVGGGIIINGKLHKGHAFFAGEFSFIRTNSMEPENLAYCWGAQSGNKALMKKGAMVKGIETLDGHQFFKYANEGDKEILEVLNEFTKNVALQIINLQSVISPEKVAIGGGISAQPLLIDYIKENLKHFSTEFSHEFKIFTPDLEIVACKFKNESNLIGALYHHLQLAK